MTDIVERLRSYIPGEPSHEECVPEVFELAAREIERLEGVIAVAQGASVKDEMLAFFLAFFDGWPADAQLTVTNLEVLDRAREKVAALSSAQRARGE